MPSRRHLLASLAALPASAAANAARAAERPFRILSIDGGGIKGVIPARILENLDLHLRTAGRPPVGESFDLFAGTSTGCIIAAALAHGASPNDMPKVIHNFYHVKGPEIFRKHAALRKRLRANPFDWSGPSYDNDIKARILDEVFGDKTLSGLKRNFMGTFYSLRSKETPPEGEKPQPEDLPRAVIASGGPLFAQEPGSIDYRLQEVVLASTSAPIYFEPARLQSSGDVAVDGGLFANNPALLAYLEAAKALNGSRSIQVVSIGCGAEPVRFTDRLKTWGPLEWADPARKLPILQAIMDSQASATDQALKRQLGSRYVRLQPRASQLGAMDNVLSENLAALTRLADDFVLGDGAAPLARLVAETPRVTA